MNLLNKKSAFGLALVLLVGSVQSWGGAGAVPRTPKTCQVDFNRRGSMRLVSLFMADVGQRDFLLNQDTYNQIFNQKHESLERLQINESTKARFGFQLNAKKEKEQKVVIEQKEGDRERVHILTYTLGVENRHMIKYEVGHLVADGDHDKKLVIDNSCSLEPKQKEFVESKNEVGSSEATLGAS